MDWDYQMLLKPYASIIHSKQYWEWRNSGLAFEFGDQTYTIPNRTMASYAEGKLKSKDSAMVRGFWLDVVVSPYVPIGIDCYRVNKFAEDLFHIQDKGTGTEQHRHHAVEIAVYNMLSFMYEMETGKKYTMRVAHDIYSGLGDDEEDGKEGKGHEATNIEVEKEEVENQPPVENKGEGMTEDVGKREAEIPVVTETSKESERY